MASPREDQADGASRGTLVVTHVRVDLGHGRRYLRGDAVAASHPDAAELRTLGFHVS